MNLPTSLLSRSVSRLTGHSQPSRKKRRPPAPRQRRFESLESRTVLSATFGSAIGLGGPEGERVMDLTLDGEGNTYVTGYYMGTADFDLGNDHLGDADILTAKGGTDAFVAKYAPDNSLLWVRSLGGPESPGDYITDSGRSLAVDQDDNVFVTGEFWGQGSFGATELVSAGGGDGFLTKLNADGTFAWAKSWGVSGWDYARGVDVDAQGNVYALNGYSETNSQSIRKLNTDGQSLWTKSIAGASGGDLAVTSVGSVFVVGSFKGKVDFDPGPNTKNVDGGTNSAGFALNLDTNGNFRWVTPFKGTGSAYATAVEVDTSGNVYAGGESRGSVDFDPTRRVATIGSAGGGYIAKLSSAGTLAWVRGLTGSGDGLSPSVNGLATDAFGNVYATGHFYSAIDLNPGTSSDIHTTSGSSDADIFVVKLSSTGNYVWGETFGGVGLDVGYGIDLDSEGNVVVGGVFTDIVDFDPDSLSEYALGSAGSPKEGFILRLNQS